MKIQQTYIGDNIFLMWDGFDFKICVANGLKYTDTIYLSNNLMEFLIQFTDKWLNDSDPSHWSARKYASAMRKIGKLERDVTRLSKELKTSHDDYQILKEEFDAILAKKLQDGYHILMARLKLAQYALNKLSNDGGEAGEFARGYLVQIDEMGKSEYNGGDTNAINTRTTV